MKPVLLLFITILFYGCSSISQGEKESVAVKNVSSKSIEEVAAPVIAISQNTDVVEEAEDEQNLTIVKGCTCIDYMYSQKGKKPLLEKIVGTHKIIVCGYSGEYEDGISLGTLNRDSSFYASGFVVFRCSGENLSSIFSDGEYYMDIVKPEAHKLKISRLFRTPQNDSLEYHWVPIISINIDLEEEAIRIDSSFIFPIETFSDEFLESFAIKIKQVKDDPNKKLEYADYFLNYSFIQAVKNPDKYSDEFKTLGPFDGYLGPIYRDLLTYYSVFQKEAPGA